MKILKWSIFIGVGSLIIFVLYKWYRCSQAGEESGRGFTCSLFSSEPKWLTALQEYTTMLQGKCYEITEYGTSMSYRRVELEECGERAPVKKQESLAEFQVINESY